MSLISFLLGIVNSILSYFFRPPAMEENKQKIYVKLPSGIFPVYLKSNWTVHDLKECMRRNVDVTSDELHIIFAGKELDDDILLQDCDVGEQSVIHAVCAKKPYDSTNEGEQELSLESSSTIGVSLREGELDSHCEGGAASNKCLFFVYCNSPCKKMTPGKLRVRCSTCKEGTLTLNREPMCWDDVLMPAKVHGICHAEDCSGTIAEFYFKCAVHVGSPGDAAVVLYLIRNNFKAIPCIACTDVTRLVLVFPCKDQHVICLECFRLYCISCLNERKFIQDQVVGYTINCPAGCHESLIVEPHHFKLLGDDQYSRYQRFAAEECVLQAGGVLCPQPGCGAGLLPDRECRRVVCSREGGSGCGFVFCRLCLQGYHIGPCEAPLFSETVSCVEHAITDERAGTSRWDDDSRNVIRTTTKPCPMCRTPTERDGGCMHMVCTRAQCGFHWCWICQEAWTRDCMGNHWFG